jgi:hypothetical protein
MKHDIAAAASHKSNQCDKYSINTNVCHVCDGFMIMNVMIADDPFEMSVTFIRVFCQDVCDPN